MKVVTKHRILLADDDQDDCGFFQDALYELPLSAELTMVHDGEELIHWLEKNSATLPNVLFLDLNMPFKSGFECLEEIRQNEKFNQLPVIIYSTSFNREAVNLLHGMGATYYICKPADYVQLRKVIHKALLFIEKDIFAKPTLEDFVISA